MDPRIERWARTLVGYCLEVQPGETVQITAGPAAEPLVREVYRGVLRAGGHPIPRIALAELSEVLLREGNDDQLAFVDPAAEMLAERVNCRLNIASLVNPRYLTNVDPARQKLHSRADRAIRQINSRRSAAGEARWCGTLYPTTGYAQEADMSLHDFEEFVYQACFLNDPDPAEQWRQVGRAQQFYVDWLKSKDQVRVLATDTDLRLSIKGRTFRNSDGKRNFPSGEFFTGPVEDSVEGTIRFTIPSVVNGQLVEDVRLTFEQGRVVRAEARVGQRYLDEMLEMDAGARYVGEFAFGNNYHITRGIKSILYDEKIGGTIHMALGNSYPETGGTNVSALHWDMVCDLRPPAGGGEIWIDGTLFEKDGQFVIGPEA
ncbi:MAG TPA: aminopeptidase [Ktedonobacterales bacterium]